jgi:site-specific DNA-cytosine methylase
LKRSAVIREFERIRFTFIDLFAGIGGMRLDSERTEVHLHQ